MAKHWTVVQAIEEADPDEATYGILIDNAGWHAVPVGGSAWLAATPALCVREALHMQYDPCD